MINLLHSRAQGMRVSLCACLTLLSCGALAAPSWPTSEPYWPHYPTRGVQVLTGNWSFGFSASVDPSTVSYADAAALAVNATAVPGSFDVAPMGVQGPRGAAIYVSQHSCTPGSTSLLKFGAVNFYARVFVDGSAIGNHSAGGYTPFQMVTPPCGSSGMRELLVATSNDDNQSPLCITCTGGDFYFYGECLQRGNPCSGPPLLHSGKCVFRLVDL